MIDIGNPLFGRSVYIVVPERRRWVSNIEAHLTARLGPASVTLINSSTEVPTHVRDDLRMVVIVDEEDPNRASWVSWCRYYNVRYMERPELDEWLFRSVGLKPVNEPMPIYLDDAPETYGDW